MVEKVAHDNGMSVGERDTEGLIPPLRQGLTVFSRNPMFEGLTIVFFGVRYLTRTLPKERYANYSGVFR